MSSLDSLVDTPRKKALESESLSLRASLKDFERSFASDHGHKPTKEDIRANEDIAAKYKTYNRIRDVLAGKLSYEEHVKPARTTPKKSTAHRRLNNVLNETRRTKSHDETPRHNRHPNEYDPYDASSSASPKPLLLTAIGPTPQRDGKVLGLFDMLSGSGSQKSHTPSSNRMKRKLDAILEESPMKRPAEDIVLRTPGSKRQRADEDILQHLTGSPRATPQTGRQNHSRTPISEGRKFMLSQFFATPSAIRHQNTTVLGQGLSQTPLRDRVLAPTPQHTAPQDNGIDATPAYLKRSTSFKDRLMSATSTNANTNPSRANTGLTSPVSMRTGPPTLNYFRAAAKPLSQIVSDLRRIEEGDHDDDLEALREMEGTQVNAVAGANQHSDNAETTLVVDENGLVRQPWKKRGQKRTTKRSKMRPARAKVANAPKFVSAERRVDSEDDEDSQSDREDELDATMVSDNTSNDKTLSSKESSHADPWLDEDFSDAFGSDIGDMMGEEDLPSKRKGKGKGDKTGTDASSTSKKTTKEAAKPGKKVGKINPNAQSHMNFRSLKIRNKNSKAKAGGRRFGRR